MLPNFATPKYDFYSSHNAAASGWATAFAAVGTSELNVTRLTGCDAYSTVSTYEDCLLKSNTPMLHSATALGRTRDSSPTT
jgi:hypothetical protein